jgi:hypothetical protein
LGLLDGVGVFSQAATSDALELGGVTELRVCSRPAIHNHSEKTHVVRDLRACSRRAPANHSGANPPNREIKSTQRPGDQAKTLCQAKSQNSI